MPPRAASQRWLRSFVSLSSILIFCLAMPAFGQDEDPNLGEYGDAPEGQEAYPWLGVPGLFPTCLFGPVGYAFHGPVAGAPDLYLGNSVDFETEGNAGFCPPPPYERDECYGAADGDGGLVLPDAFTIFQSQIIPCGQTPPRSLGSACEVLDVKGPNSPLVVQIHNTTGIDAYLNIVFDWNQDGRWGGDAFCPTGGLFPEHAIVNLPVPPFYIGSLQGLNPGPIIVGPNPGYVWMRITLSPDPGVMQPWDGSGIYDMGETEDYLIRIDPAHEAGDLGDAPEGALAYPNGVFGGFPTCVVYGPANYVYHRGLRNTYFGPDVDFEVEGNANTCPQPDYDLDECEADGDAGLLFPQSYTVLPNGTFPACPTASGNDLLLSCDVATWGTHVDIEITNNSADDRYLNVLFDWDQGGNWGGALTCPNSVTTLEHVLENFLVPAGFSGTLSQLNPPDFLTGPGGFVWARFSIGDATVPSDWDGSYQFGDGETEDYLFYVRPQSTDAPPADVRGRAGIESVQPNPFNPRTSIVLRVIERAVVTVTIHDASGRRVRALHEGELAAGLHPLTWDGRDDHGSVLAAGVYFVKMVEGENVQSRKVVLVK